MDYRWLDLNREPVWINCRGYIIRDDQQEPIYLIGCINEIGNRQKADNITGLLGETSLEKYFKNSVSTLNKGFLIHVGIDTVKLNGEGFEALVESGQTVKKGDPMLKLDLEYLKTHAPSVTSPVLCTELEENQRIRLLADGPVKAGDPLFAIEILA